MRTGKRLIRIKSRGGLANRTKVSIGGRPIDGVRKVELLPIEAGGLVLARITCVVNVDIEAELGDKQPKEPT
jgi:hypothetical protein